MRNGPHEPGAAERPDAIEGGRALLRGRVLGFPVHLDLSFVIVMGVLGWYPGVSATQWVIWLLITPLAVLVHELGHAVLARTTGAHPQIALAGLGGLTSFVPPHPLSRARSIAISLAGPAVGIVIGLAALLLDQAVVTEPGSWQDALLWTVQWTSLGWSLLNLLPILPLDGGQTLRELLPGDPQVRARRAAMASVVVAAAAVVASYLLLNSAFLSLMLGVLAVSNVLNLREPTAPPPLARQVVAHLWNARPDRAREVLAARTLGEPVDLVVHAAVMTLTDDRQQGLALFAQERAARPQDPDVWALYALTLALLPDWETLRALAADPSGRVVPEAVWHRVRDLALAAGRSDVGMFRSSAPPIG